jgi:hypothetical protein
MEPEDYVIKEGPIPHENVKFGAGLVILILYIIVLGRWLEVF